MTTSPENKPKLRFSPAERALGARLVVTADSSAHGSAELRVSESPVDSGVEEAGPIGDPSGMPSMAESAQKQEQPSAFLRRKFDNWYELVDEVRADSTTITYKAVELSSNQFVTIKVLLPYFIEKTRSQQLVQHRLQTAQSLAHDAIVPVRAVGVNDEGQTYIVEDFTSGISLKELIEQESPISLKTVVDIFVQLCDGLEYAHSRGIVHGSLKPEDVVLFPDSSGGYRAQIRNFAIDALIPTRDEDVQRLTGCGVLLGPELAEYLSPEQCMGGVADCRSDIFALGCMMYQALSGQKPIEADSFVQALTRQISETPLSFADICDDCEIPEAFESVIFKCLQKKSSERYQRASQLRLALMLPQVLNGRPKPRVSHTNISKHVDRDSSQMRKIALISGGIVAAILTAATIFVWIPNQLPPDVVLLSQPGDSTDPSNANVSIDEYKDPEGTGLQGALESASAKFERNPHDTNALLVRSEAHLGLHKYEDALADLELRESILRGDLARHEEGAEAKNRALKLKVETLTHLGRLHEALSICDRLLAANPNDVSTLMLRADARVALGQGAASLVDARKVLQAEPHAADAFVRMARAYNALGKPHQARDAALKAEELSPDNMFAYGEHSKALTALGLKEEAESLCWKAFEYGTDLPESYVWLGDSYLSQGKPIDALYEYSQATTIDPTLADGYLGAAEANFKLSRYADAIAEAQKVLKFEGRRAAAYRLLSAAYRALGDQSRADEMLKAAKAAT